MGDGSGRQHGKGGKESDEGTEGKGCNDNTKIVERGKNKGD